MDARLSVISTNLDEEIDYWLLHWYNRKINALQVSNIRIDLSLNSLHTYGNVEERQFVKTIKANTRMHCSNVSNGLTKRFRPVHDFIRYRLLQLPTREFYTDMMISKI